MKKFFYCFVFLLIGLFMISCGGNDVTQTQVTKTKTETIVNTNPKTETVTQEVTNTKIEVTSFGKTNYILGDEFDCTGYVITLYKSDGTTLEINLDNEMISIDMSSQGKITGKIEYLGLATDIKITIEAVKPVELILTTVGKDYYWYSQSLDLSGYEFSVRYNNGEVKSVSQDLISYDFNGFLENETDDAIFVDVEVSANIDGVILYNTITVKNYSEWIYEEIEIDMHDKETIEYVSSITKELIPTDVDYRTEALTFLDSSDLPYKGYVVTWSSSNTRIISPIGEVTPDEDDFDVTLKVTLKRGSKILYTNDFNVSVKGLGPVVFPPFDKTQKHVFAYSYNGNFLSLNSSTAREIDFYNYCFANIGNDHKITLDGLTHLDEVLSYRRKYNVRVILSIKNGPWEETVTNSEYLLTFVMSVIDVINTYHFDGIDIDWEFPPKVSGAPMFTELIKTLREYMDIFTPGKFLTAALIGGGSVSNVKEYYECDKANDILDYAHIMTYDLNISSLASHHTNPLAGRAYSAEGSISFYHDAGFDYDKLVIGCAFYGKSSELVNKYDSATTSVLNAAVSSTTTVTYNYIKNNILTDSSYQKYYDERCGAYYLTNGKVFITYETPESIYTKGRLVKRYGLGGLMFWDLGSDNSGELLSAVYGAICDINNGRM